MRASRVSRLGSRVGTLVTVVTAALVLSAVACGGRLIRQYEYEEEIFLDLDGSATVVVNASVPALVALHGLTLDLNPQARLDRAALRRAYETPYSRVTRVSRPWRRHGRRFVQIRLELDDIGQLPRLAPFAGNLYRLSRRDASYEYRQVIGAPRRAAPGGVNWNGRELAGFRLHLPSKIQYHNTQRVGRGNILAWEQPLPDRLRGAPLVMEARMESQSILYRTLWLFGLAFGAAILMMILLIWWVMKKGSDPDPRPLSPDPS